MADSNAGFARPANANDPSLPRRFGALAFPGFQALDLFGPLDSLNTLSWIYDLELCIIGPSLEPVSTKPVGPAAGLINSKSNFAESISPTHTIDNAPPVDVLLIPGGMGTEASSIKPFIDFVKRVYPSLKYIVTVCTGSHVVAQAGILDGKKATSNKALWARTAVVGPNVQWVPRARWVVDDNIWTSSGVTAGLDAILAFIEEVYGGGAAEWVTNSLEYDRHTDPSWDPFAEKYGLDKKGQ